MDFRTRCERVYFGNQSFSFLTFVTVIPPGAEKPVQVKYGGVNAENPIKSISLSNERKESPSQQRKERSQGEVFASLIDLLQSWRKTVNPRLSLPPSYSTLLLGLIAEKCHHFGHSASPVSILSAFPCNHDDVIGCTARRTTGYFGVKQLGTVFVALLLFRA